MRKLLLAVVAVLMGVPLLLIGPPAFACSCAEPAMGRMLADSDAAFLGRVAESDGTVLGHEVVLRVDVKRVYQGTVRASTEVVTDSDEGACGFDPPKGDVIFFASYDEGDLTANLCSSFAAKRYVDAPALASYDKPLAGETSSSRLTYPELWPLLVGLAGVASLTTLFFRLRRKPQPAPEDATV